MSSHRRLFALLASLLVLSVAGAAAAQATGITVTLAATPVVHSVARTGFRLNTQINHADCVKDDILNFSVVLNNRGSFALQAWAGSGCDSLTNRTMAGSTLCWKLFDALPNTNVVTVPIHVRDLLAGKTIYGAGTTSTTTTGGTGGTDAGGTSGTGGDTSVTAGTGGTAGTDTSTGGTTSTTTTTSTLPTGTLVTGSGEDACTDNSGIPVVTPITVYFMLVDGNSAIQGTFVQWAGMYKLLAPNPPSTVTSDIGDGLLPLHFGYVNNQSNDTTINGYQFFCDPPPGSAAAADAGVSPMSDGDGGVISGICAPSTRLSAGDIADSQYQCGSASLSATAGNATGLVNFVAYNVGVSATDTYENVGVLSTLTCNVPQPVNGFFKSYRNAGGQGGGGFCSFSPKGEPFPLLALLGLASCLVLRRRRAA